MRDTLTEIGESYTEEDTLQELIDPYADLERASPAAFDGDVMAGYMKIRFKPTADEIHRVFLDGGVHPLYRRRGIGTARSGSSRKPARAEDAVRALGTRGLKLPQVVDYLRPRHVKAPSLDRSFETVAE